MSDLQLPDDPAAREAAAEPAAREAAADPAVQEAAAEPAVLEAAAEPAAQPAPAAPPDAVARFRSFLAGPLRPIHLNVLAALCAGWVLLEFLAHKVGGPFSVLAAQLWIMGWVAVLASILWRFVRDFVSDFREGNWTTLVAMPLLFFLLVRAATDFDKVVIGQDALQQIKAGLDSFRVSDWNYTGTAFLGYPNRQYVLAALSPLLFGRTLGALQAGFAYPFFLAILALFSALRATARAENLPRSLPAVACLSFLVFPYVTEYYLYFEHTLFPLCFLTMAIAFWLQLRVRPSLLPALGILWTVVMLAGCYTPALGALALIVAVTGARSLHFARRREGVASGIQAALCLAAAGFMGIGAFLARRGDIAAPRTEEVSGSLEAALEGYRIFFLNRPAVFAGILAIPIALWIILSLAGRLGSLHFLSAVWVLGIVGAAQVLKGYAVYSHAVNMSRTLITVPVLVVAILLALYRWVRDRETLRGLPHFLAIWLVFAFFMGAYNLGVPVNQGDAAKYFHPGALLPHKYVAREIESLRDRSDLDPGPGFPVVFYTDRVWFRNLRNYTDYLLPGSRAIVLATGDELPDDLNLGGGAIVLAEDGFDIAQVFLDRAPVVSRTFTMWEDHHFTVDRIVVPAE